MKRWPILDFLRGVAIICVVLDHLGVWLGYNTTQPQLYSLLIFSVAPLFFLAGITFGLSFYHRPPVLKSFTQYTQYWWRKSRPLITTYLVGFTLMWLWQYHSLELKDFLSSLLTFPNQFYFICIYLQLLLLAPLLAQWWPKIAKLKMPLSLGGKMLLTNLLLLLLALILNQLPILSSRFWLPAQLLFGGIELWIFGTGVQLAYLFFNQRLPQIILQPLVQLIIGLVLFSGLALTSGLQTIFQHPPTFATIIYAASGLLILTALYHGWQRLPFAKCLTQPLLIAGRYSLDIFIFHSLFIQEILQRYPWWTLPAAQPFKVILLLIIVCSLSLALGRLIQLTLTPKKIISSRSKKKL
jgi:peptidoglycan/LPS O-acetylase OafA/YrhL